MSTEDINNPDASGLQTDDAPAEELKAALSGEGGEENFVVTEPRKPLNRTTLVLFAIVALGTGGLYLMHLRTGPKSAGAAPQSVAANQTITQFLSSGNNNLRNMEQMLRNTQKIVQQFLAYPSINQVPLKQLQTNPFRATVAKDGETASEADARKRQDDEKAAIKRAVENLQIQSILHGARRACMINNTMCVEGQQIDGFTIEKINPSSVVVKNGSYRFELQMQR
jgi:hypothetical protein